MLSGWNSETFATMALGALALFRDAVFSLHLFSFSTSAANRTSNAKLQTAAAIAVQIVTMVSVQLVTKSCVASFKFKLLEIK